MDLLMPVASSKGFTAAAVTVALLCAATALVLARRWARLGRYAQRAGRHRDHVARVRRAQRANELSATERYWIQVRESTAPVLVTSLDGQILAASAAATQLFGYADEAQIRTISILDLYVNVADRLHLAALLREHGQVRSGEFRMTHRDGHEIRVLATVRVVELGEGQGWYESVITDITELREAVEQGQRLQAQLHLARKLELVGQLASGIAHEINTPMQFIGDNINFLKGAFDRLAAQLTAPAGAAGITVAGGPAAVGRRKPLAAKEQEALLADVADAFAGSLEGVERVSETVRAMKEFAHPGDLEITSTDLNQAIRTTLVVARNEYKHAAEVLLQLGEIPPVDCRRAEINKVFLNLIVNAAHAIEEHGKGTRGIITISTRAEADSVRVDIADTGCGIPPAVLPRIFDPFFTTKAIGKGSGQGLAIVRTIIKDHGGDLKVASKVGQGTTFTISLPAVAGSEASAAYTSAVDLEAPIG